MNQQNSQNDSQQIQPDDELNTLVEQNKFPIITKQFLINNIQYEYQGPDHPQIAELLELLDEKQRKPYSNEFLESIRQKAIEYENKFNKNCIFCEGMCAVSFYFVFSIIVNCCIYFAFLASALTLKQDGAVTSNSTKSTIVDQLPQYGLMLLSFSLIISVIKNYLILVIFFFAGCIFPSYFLFYVYLDIFNINTTMTYDTDMIVFLSFFIISILNGIIISTLQQTIESMFNQIAGAFIQSGWCLFVVYLLGFLIFSYVIGLDVITFEKIIDYVVNSLYIPIFVIIITSYILINSRLFDWPAGIIKTALDRIKIKILKQQLSNEQGQSTTMIKFQSILSKIVIYSMGATYVTMEIVFYILLANEIKSSTVNYFTIVTLSLELILIPLYLFLGIFISVSDRKPQYTYLIVPLVIGAPVIFGFQKLGDYLYYEQNITNFTELLYICPLFVNILWIALTLMGLDKRRLFINSLGFVCFFIAIPLGIFFPLYNLYNSQSLQITAYIFLLFGIIVLTFVLFYFFYQSLKALKRAKELADQIIPTFDEFKYYNLTDLAFCINSVCFLISYFVISYFFWYLFGSESTASETEAATMYAILVLIPIIFILINVALGHHSLEITQEYINDIRELQKIEELKNIKRKQKLFYQNAAVLCGVIIPLTIFLPLSLALSNEKASVTFEALTIGIPLTFFIYKFLTYIKNQSIVFEDFFQPFVSSIFWCCIIFPFGVIAPTMAVFLNNADTSFTYFAQGMVGLGLFVCIIGVTGTSLFFSLLLNREEFERKKREILRRVMEILAQNHVISDISVVGILYMKYLNKMQILYSNLKTIKNISKKKQKKIEDIKQLKQSLTESLIQGDPVNVVKYDGPDLEYDHKLVSQNVYNEYFKLLENELINQSKNIQSEKELTGCKKYLLDCLCCRCGLEEMNELENQKNIEIIKLRDLLKLNEEMGKKMNQLIPEFDNVYKIADESDKLLQKIDYQAEDKQLINKSQYKPIENLSSEKTQKLKEVVKKQSNDKLLKNIKSSEQFFSMQKSDDMISDFMHEVFMEFANTDQGLEPSICYNDLLEFCRLTDIHFTLNDYNKYAHTIWINQSFTLNESEFAGLIKGIFNQFDGDVFENLKQLVLDHIYPQLMINMKSLMINLKFSNKKFLKNQLSNSPFSRNNFTNQQIVPSVMTKTENLKQQQKQMKEEQLGRSQEGNKLQILNTKSQKQKQREYAEGKQQIELEYQNKLPWYKKCCYSCNESIRQNFILKYFPNLAAVQPQPKIQKLDLSILGESREQMPDWKVVAKITINTLFEASEEYENNRMNQEQKQVELKATSSNIIALIFRIYDIYGLAIVAFNSQVGWFGSSSFSGSSTISGQAFYNSYAFFFYSSLGISILYGFLGSFSLEAVQKNTFGQDEQGNIASFPKIQFFLPRGISILNGFFLTVMRTYMDAFVCNYNSYPYKFERDTSIECLSTYHYIYMALALIGVGIYYPLCTYLQPTFQFGDHSLDLKYKSTYMIIYVQCKLLITGLSSFFDTYEGAFQYQMLFSIGILIMLLGIHIRMEPCFVKWYNVVEQLLFMIVIFIYTGAVIIMFTNNNIIGIVFTSITMALGIVAIIIYLKFYVFKENNKKKQKITPEIDYSSIELKPIPEENKLNIFDLIAEAQQENQKPRRKVRDQTKDTQDQFPNLEISYGVADKSGYAEELIRVKDEINLEPHQVEPIKKGNF